MNKLNPKLKIELVQYSEDTIQKEFLLEYLDNQEQKKFENALVAGFPWYEWDKLMESLAPV